MFGDLYESSITPALLSILVQKSGGICALQHHHFCAMVVYMLTLNHDIGSRHLWLQAR